MYDIVYADFPWPYTPFGTAKLPYKCMSEEEIARFDWSIFLARRAVVFHWVTGPKSDVAYRCMEAWRVRHGLHFQGEAYVWIKTRQNGTPIGASGPRPRYVKPLTETVVVLSNVPGGRAFPLLTEAQEQTVFSPKPRPGQHSRKPEEVRRRIVELLGDRSRIELFCRGVPADGWDGWGDECYRPVVLPTLRG